MTTLPYPLPNCLAMISAVQQERLTPLELYLTLKEVWALLYTPCHVFPHPLEEHHHLLKYKLDAIIAHWPNHIFALHRLRCHAGVYTDQRSGRLWGIIHSIHSILYFGLWSTLCLSYAPQGIVLPQLHHGVPAPTSLHRHLHPFAHPWPPWRRFSTRVSPHQPYLLGTSAPSWSGKPRNDTKHNTFYFLPPPNGWPRDLHVNPNFQQTDLA